MTFSTESEIVRLAKDNIPCKTIARILGVSKYVVSDILIKNNFTYHVKPIPEEDINLIIKLYKDDYKSFRDIAKITGYSAQKAKEILLINKINIRPTAYHSTSKLKMNENYFDNIDSEHKAYWLGFLYADGYNNEKTYQIEITLKESDAYILDELKKDTKAIYKITNKTIHLNEVDFYAKRIILYSKHMSQTLKAKGCYQNKSLTLDFPSSDIVPDNLIHHFMRGYFDGDGCISGSKFSLVGTKIFLDSYVKLIKANTTISNAGSWSTTGKAYQWQHAAKRDLKKIYDYLYKDATIFLIRKKEKFLIK